MESISSGHEGDKKVQNVFSFSWALTFSYFNAKNISERIFSMFLSCTSKMKHVLSSLAQFTLIHNELHKIYACLEYFCPSP